jgi:hypothetical protein
MQRALGAVNHFVDLVPRMVELLFGFTSATIGFAFGFKVLVAGETSGSLLTRPSLLIVDEVGFLPLDPLTSASTC